MGSETVNAQPALLTTISMKPNLSCKRGQSACQLQLPREKKLCRTLQNVTNAAVDCLSLMSSWCARRYLPDIAVVSSEESSLTASSPAFALRLVIMTVLFVCRKIVESTFGVPLHPLWISIINTHLTFPPAGFLVDL